MKEDLLAYVWLAYALGVVILGQMTCTTTCSAMNALRDLDR